MPRTLNSLASEPPPLRKKALAPPTLACKGARSQGNDGVGLGQLVAGVELLRVDLDACACFGGGGLE